MARTAPPSDYRPGGRPFTGRRMLAVILGFFGVIFAVNFLMAWLAVSNFRGTVVDSGFVASQDFNATRAAAQAQAERGWTVSVIAIDGAPVIALRGPDGEPLRDVALTAAALRPLDQRGDAALTLEQVAPGVWRAAETLGPGRWRIAFTAEGLGDPYVASHPLFIPES
jgi:nitrogen fixation protein FixH